MDIIPGLPNDIAFHCLIQLPFSQLHSLRSVCKAWKSQIKLSVLLRLRNSVGKAQSRFVLARKKVIGFDLLVFEPETGFWSEMPPLPNGLPGYYDCEMVVVGSNLVVIGGYDEQTECNVDSVFIFDFLSSTWRCGTNLPDGGRGRFGCATDGDRTVFVAGGYNMKKACNVVALKSAWTYDVITDNWNQLPDMARERSLCKGLFHRGKFHVINGYPTTTPLSLETFDMSTREWSEKVNMLSYIIHSTSSCVVGSDQKVYTCRDGNILELEDDDFQFVAKLPINMAYTNSIISSLGYLWLKGQSKCGKLSIFYIMDLKERIWTKLDIPAKVL